MKKIISLLLVLIAVFSFTTSALADDSSLGANDTARVKVWGGSPLYYGYGDKDEPNTMDINVRDYDINGQSDMKFRGYELYSSSPSYYKTTAPCTYAKTITGRAYRTATYTSSPARAELRISIASPYDNVYAYLAGHYFI